MFHGSIPAPMQAIINEIVRGWKCTDIYVGCSGNFTIEKVLGKDKKFNLHSNDVTIYSSMIGRYLSGERLGITLKPEWLDEFGWLESYMTNDADILATVLLSTRLFEGLGKANPYYERMREAYKNQWPELHGKTADKIRKTELRINSYFCGDVVDWLDNVPADQGVICFPPFFANDYKNMFAKLEEVFDWQAPEYQEITEERKTMLLDKMREKKYWILGVNYRMEGWEQYLRGLTQTTNRGVPIYIYASKTNTRIVQPRQEVEQVTNPRLQRGEKIGNHITLATLNTAQFQALRSQYMNRHIKPGMATVAVAVLVDGIMVGVYALSAAPSMANWSGKIETPHIYLLSDFPVAPTDYKHLAKLVLYAALSSEGKLLAERATNHRVRTMITTAFTNKPVSMKYRGLFNLLARKENPEWAEGQTTADTYYKQKYMLNYAAPMGKWTLAEGLKLWKKKHGGSKHGNKNN